MCKVSKQSMLDKIINTVSQKSYLLQWKNLDAVIYWFSELENKQRTHFTQFNVVNFDASIAPDLLENSLTFAATKLGTLYCSPPALSWLVTNMATEQKSVNSQAHFYSDS